MSISPDVIDLRARSGETPEVAELRDEWGRRSRERLGLTRQQWHHPAAAELVTAILGGAPFEPALVRLGEARAAAGVSLGETLADVAVLDELLPIDGPQPGSLDNLATAGCIGGAWAEAHYGSDAPASCVDELTGLVTVPFLEARLQQIYRHCSYLGMRPTEAYALVVAQIDRQEPSPFRRVAQRLRLAGDLRLCFPGSDTLAVLDPTGEAQTMVALTSRAPELATAVEALAVDSGQRHVWVAALPPEVDDAIALVRTLPEIDA
jgi:hypothetical protein